MTKIEINPPGEIVDAKEGTSLLKVANDLGISVESPCGGEEICGRCRVIINQGSKSLSTINEAERMLLSQEEIDSNYRLSCSAKVGTEPVSLRIAPGSKTRDQIVLSDGKTFDFEINPAIEKYHTIISNENRSGSIGDYELVRRSLEDQYSIQIDDIDPLALRTIPSQIRPLDGSRSMMWRANVTVRQDEEIIDISPSIENGTFGMAFDLGTTTIVGYLVDLRTGDVLAVESGMNPQIQFGEDLVSRLEHVQTNDTGQDLQRVLIDAVNDIIHECCRAADIPQEEVYELVMVGNTAMHHLFLGIDINGISTSPYNPAITAAHKVNGRDLGVQLHRCGYIQWLPLVAGWIGADAISAILASQLHSNDDITLLIDAGTNGEVIAGSSDRILACSTPLGPAFEGGALTNGMRAAPGGIDSVTVDPESFQIDYTTIDNKPARGICGSGVIDALAELYRAGLLDQTGSFVLTQESNPPLRKTDNGRLECVLVDKDEAGTGQPIIITQGDIREIQKAKGALQAAASILLDKLDVSEPDRVLLAGGFGTFVNPESARVLGLYPDVPLDIVESIGNAAGSGARLALMNQQARSTAETISNDIKHIELAGTELFRERFIEAMQIPNMDSTKFERTLNDLES